MYNKLKNYNDIFVEQKEAGIIETIESTRTATI